MDRSVLITLVKTTYQLDDNGVRQRTETTKNVFANVQSVSANEFFEGGRSGLQPEYRFTMFRFDYSGEPIVIYNGIRYAVYRTYIGRNDMIELYVERKGGTNASKIAPEPTPTSTPTPEPTPDPEEPEDDGE